MAWRAWRFVAWGGAHGLFLILERGLRGRFGHLAPRGWAGMWGWTARAGEIGLEGAWWTGGRRRGRRGGGRGGGDWGERGGLEGEVRGCVLFYLKDF